VCERKEEREREGKRTQPRGRECVYVGRGGRGWVEKEREIVCVCVWERGVGRGR